MAAVARVMKTLVGDILAAFNGFVAENKILTSTRTPKMVIWGWIWCMKSQMSNPKTGSSLTLHVIKVAPVGKGFVTGWF